MAFFFVQGHFTSTRWAGRLAVYARHNKSPFWAIDAIWLMMLVKFMLGPALLSLSESF